MPIAVFAKKTFQVSSKKIITFSDFSLSGSYETESQAVSGKKPSTFKKGPGLETMTFNIPLNASFGVNVMAELKWWRSIRDAGVPYPFTIGGVALSPNKWLVKTVNVNDPDIDNKGIFRKVMLEITFEEYVRPGTVPKKTTTKKAAAKKKSKGKSKSSKAPVRVDTDLLLGKRNNPNAKSATANGTKKKKK